MATIEDILYKAYQLGIVDEVFECVNDLIKKQKYRVTDLNHIYTKAFYQVLENKSKDN